MDPTLAFDRFALQLADGAAKGCAILIVAAGAAWLLRHRSAAAQHLVWLAAVVALVLLPIASAVLPQRSVAVLPARANPAPGAAPRPALNLFWVKPPTPPTIDWDKTEVGEATAPPPSQSFGTAPAPRLAPARPGAPGYARWIVAIWAAGATTVLGRWLAGMSIVAYRRSTSVPLDDGPSRTITAGRRTPVLVSDRSPMPMATGLFRPAILLPIDARSWPADKLRAVLLHELAHVRRMDCLTQAIAQLALALHWFNPLAWWAVRQMGVERERACDDAVLAAGALPSGYAAHLLDVARALHAGFLTRAAAVPMARPSQLEGRVLGILDPRRHRRLMTRRAAVAGLLVAAAVALPLAALRLARAQVPTTSPYKPIAAVDRPPTSDVTGTVSDESGRPVAGATVLAVRGWEEHPDQRTATTDPAGRFAFPSLKPAGDWHFSVNDSRFGCEWHHERGFMVPAQPEDVPVRIKLYRPRTLHGTIVDDDGKPVGGARIILANQWLAGAHEPVSGHLDTDFLVTNADADGRFTVRRLRPGKATFWLQEPGYANTLDDVDVPEDDKDRKLTINRGLTLHGRVMHDGKPVAGVQLHAGYNEAHRSMIDWMGVSDTDGRFTVEHVPVRAPDVRSRAYAVPVSIAQEDPAWYSSTYELYQTGDRELPPVTIEARRREPGKEPHWDLVEVGKPGQGPTGTVRVMLPGLRGSPTVMLGGMQRAATTAPVVFTEVPVGKHSISAHFDDDDPARPPKTVTVVAGQTVDVTLEPGASQIRGTIRSGGKPIVGGPDSYLSYFRYPPGVSGVGVFQGGTKVRPDGTYVVDGLQPGGYELLFSGPNSMVVTTMAQVGAGAVALPNWDLPTGRIEGRVIGMTPKRYPDLKEIGAIDVFPRGFPTRMPPSAGVMLDPGPDGRFTVEHLVPGWYTITCPGLTGTFEAGTVMIDRPGGVATIELRVPQHTGEIAGTLTGHLPAGAGEPFNPLSVYAFPKDAQGYDFRAGHLTEYRADRGDYRLRDLPAGVYGVFVSGSLMRGNESTGCVWIPDVDVREGQSRDLPMVMPEGRVMRFVTADRRPPYGPVPTCTDWRVQLPSGDWLPRSLLEVGVGLPFGRYTIEAQYGPGGAIVSQPFTVEAGNGEQVVNVTGPR